VIVQGVVALCAGSRSEPQVYLSVPPHGALDARRRVFDAPTWCGAMTTALCGGRGDPLPWWRSSSVEIGIKVTGDLA